MLQILRLGLLSLALLLVAACGRDAPTRPEPQTRMATFLCGEWSPPVPYVDQAVFDLQVPGTPGEEGPDPIAVEMIRSADGVIVHEYHVARVRAVLPMASVPLLDFNATQVAPDEPLRVRLNIVFDYPLSDADRAFLESEGAEIIRTTDIPGPVDVTLVLATVLDDSIPRIRAYDRVQSVGSEVTACPAARLTSSSATP